MVPVLTWLHKCAELYKHVCTTQDNADLSSIDISEHVVLYRAAVSWLSWHLFITSVQVTDTHTHTRLDTCQHMFILYSVSFLFGNYSSDQHVCALISFYFTPFFLSDPIIHQKLEWSKAEKKNQMNKDWDEGNLETKSNIHFTGMLQMISASSSAFSHSLYPFFFGFSHCGNVLQVWCVYTCKSRRSIDFLSPTVWCVRGYCVCVCVPYDQDWCEEHMNKNVRTSVTIMLQHNKRNTRPHTLRTRKYTYIIYLSSVFMFVWWWGSLLVFFRICKVFAKH